MINLGQYLPGDTLLHRLDPRVKICAVMALSLLIFAATPAGIALISLFLAALIRIARLTLAQTAAALRPVAVFMAADLPHAPVCDRREHRFSRFRPSRWR